MDIVHNILPLKQRHLKRASFLLQVITGILRYLSREVHTRVHCTVAHVMNHFATRDSIRDYND